MIPAELGPVADHLWQSTLFVAAVWLVQFALLKNRAAVRHRLWLAASFKFLVPFALLTAIGSHFHWNSTPLAPSSEVSIAVDQFVQPFTALQPEILAIAPRRPQTIDLLDVLLFVWICGFVASIFWWTMQWLKLYLAKRSGAILNVGSFSVPIVSCPSRMEPGVFGVFKPVLLLPDGLAEKLTAEEFQAVLAHEQRHIERRDNLAASTHMMVESLFWFHPLVWWISGRLVEEQERACDEDVLQLGQDPQIYAKSILLICEFYVTSPVMCMSGITGADLKRRISAIMGGGRAKKLSLFKTVLLVGVAAGAISIPVLFGAGQSAPQPQSNDAGKPLEFEAATIKANNSGGNSVEWGCHGIDSGDKDVPLGRCVATNAPLKFIIALAYGVKFFQMNEQITGGPEWLVTDRYNLEAKSDPPATEAQLYLMLQTFLAERVKLKTHRQSKEVQAFALVVAPGGAKLKQSKEGVETGARIGGGRIIGQLTISQLSQMLSAQTGRLVLDKTGLTGLFDVSLNWQPEPGVPDDFRKEGAASSDSSAPSIFTAVQEQLGLKLEATKSTTEILVVESAERPNELKLH